MELNQTWKYICCMEVFCIVPENFHQLILNKGNHQHSNA
jgi:hypothetical protein